MKRLKIILAAVATIAVVAGTLAYKANQISSYCVKSGNTPFGTCTATFLQSKIDPLAPSYWTTTYDGTDCLEKTCDQTRIRLTKG